MAGLNETSVDTWTKQLLGFCDIKSMDLHSVALLCYFLDGIPKKKHHIAPVKTRFSKMKTKKMLKHTKAFKIKHKVTVNSDLN